MDHVILEVGVNFKMQIVVILGQPVHIMPCIYVIRNVWTIIQWLMIYLLSDGLCILSHFPQLAWLSFVSFLYILRHMVLIGTLWWLPPSFCTINNMSKYFDTCTGCVNVIEIWPSTLYLYAHTIWKHPSL